MNSADPREIAIVGAGPRGLSVLERLSANERHTPSARSLVVHVVDPAAPGAGAVWRAAQAPQLLMNTVASQVTIYTDHSVEIEGPIEPGPSLWDWAQEVARRPTDRRGEPHGADAGTAAEARALGPDSYPTRAFYGRYLRESFHRIVNGAPPHVTVRVHATRAVAAADTHARRSGLQGLRLENGERLNELEAVVLAQGHLPSRPTPRQERTASLARIHHLTYLTPANPADLDLREAGPGETVLLRGLGLNFFDHMAMLTVGRGGSFDAAEGAGAGPLAYRPSGHEPHLVAFSRRGVPHHARGENEKGAYGRHIPRALTPEVIADLRARRDRGEAVRFSTHLWPLITREVESVYYATLLRGRGQDPAGLETEFLTAAARTPQRADPTAPAGLARSASERPEVAAVLDRHGIGADLRWDWRRIEQPCAAQHFADREAFRRWLIAHLRADVAAARAGNVTGPVKAALDVLRDLRNEIRLVVDHGGLEGHSYREELEGWYTPLNAYLSIGPPVRRIEEMIALLEAGILEVTGPDTQVRLDPARPAFVAASRTVPGPPLPARTLVESRLPDPDLRRTDDPLMRHLLDTGQGAPYRIESADGFYETGGLAVSERPYRLIDAHGRPHPRRFALGVPTEAVHWVTAAGIRPGVDSVSLGDSDAIARAVLTLPPAARIPDPLPDPSDPAAPCPADDPEGDLETAELIV